jgi:hypothetical protein
MKTPRRPLAPVLLALALAAAVGPGAGRAAQDVANPPAAAKPAVAAPAAEVAPPAMTPREKTGVYVFLAWTWLTIGVLLYVLRLKVREADRVLRTGFFGPSGGGKERREPR